MFILIRLTQHVSNIMLIVRRTDYKKNLRVVYALLWIDENSQTEKFSRIRKNQLDVTGIDVYSH